MGREKPPLAKPDGGLLEPLPTFNLVESVDKLDAGLRSLDHCEYNLAHPFRRDIAYTPSR